MIPSLEKLDNTIATSFKDNAETLNSFFNSVFITENVHNIPTISVIDNLVPLSDIVIDSKGPDKWHSVFLKGLSNELCMYSVIDSI